MSNIMEAKTGSCTGSHNEWLTMILPFGLIDLVAHISFHLKVAMLALRLKNSHQGVLEASVASQVVIVVTAVTSREIIVDPAVSPFFCIYQLSGGNRISPAFSHRRPLAA